MKHAFLWIIFIQSISLFAKQGDTLIVQSHKDVDQVWNGNYDKTAYFPEDKSWNRIMMKYTLSCPTSGCSDWDYDVNVWLMHNTGAIDTIIARVDTLSQSPLILDTIFKYQPHYQPFELGRYITPYGTYMNHRNPSYGTAGYDSSWKHIFWYDVTDFAGLLKDSVLIRNQYRGWSSGFRCNIEFIMVEGKPIRPVLAIQSLYESGGTYTTTSEFETKRMPAKSFKIPVGTSEANLRVIITGHGADNANGCGEFCDKNYYLKVNGQPFETKRMWRDDCGLVAVKPQGGTWIFDRGNWCPGDLVHPFIHSIGSQQLKEDSLVLDIDLDPSIATGNNSASYNASATLFFYGQPTYQSDAAIIDILSPSTQPAYKHWNPVCGEVKLVIRNEGKQNLSHLKFRYGLENGKSSTYDWSGSLNFMEMDTIAIPAPDLSSGQGVFHVYLQQINHALQDGNSSNNQGTSSYQPVLRFEPFTLFLKTNGMPKENKLTLSNEKGQKVFEWNNLDANKIYQQDFDLAPGCYQLVLSDSGKDGLHFWYYAQTGQTARTNGFFRIMKKSGGFYQNTINDFGTEYRLNFTVGDWRMPEAPLVKEPLKVFPNPAREEINIQFASEMAPGKAHIRIFDHLGKMVQEQKDIEVPESFWYNYPLNGIRPGLYSIEVETIANGKSSFYKEKIIINP